VVQRDQGVWIPAREVCRDFELIVAVARHYAATGDPLSSAIWE
jgi:hypothetical protein